MAWATLLLMEDHYDTHFSPAKDYYFWITASILMTCSLVASSFTFCINDEACYRGKLVQTYSSI